MTLTFNLTDKQKEVRSEFALAFRYFLVYGGSRCLSGESILDGHTKTVSQLAKEGRRIRVLTSHGWQEVDAPFRKGSANLLRVETDCGRIVEVTPDHRFWDGLGWVKARDLIPGDALAVSRSSAPFLLGTSLERTPLECQQDAAHLTHTGQDYQGGYSTHPHQCGEQPRPVADRGLTYRASLSDALEHIRDYLPHAAHGLGIHTGRQHPHASGCILTDQWLSRPSTPGDCPLIDQGGGLSSRVASRIFGWFQEIRRTRDQDQSRSPLRQFGTEGGYSYCGQSDQSFFVSKRDTPSSDGYAISGVKSITRTAKQGYYTLHVPRCEHYFANGMMHHNSGKTFFICYAILMRALKAPGSRHAIFRNDGASAKQSIGNETIPKVVELAFPGLGMKWNDRDGYYTLPNGSQIWLCGLKDKERLDKVLGKEYVTIYLNEASQITLEAFELVKSRLAQVVNQVDGRVLPQKFYVDLNPTTSAHWTYQIFVLGKDPSDKRPIPDHKADYCFMMVNPSDNTANLSPEYIKSLENMPERQRRRFFEGAYNADDDNALWNRGVITHEKPPELGRIVVAVDPAISSNVGSDETGIIGAGADKSGRGYVLGDESGKFKPEQWARRAISLYDTLDADCIVAESNQGGEMVRSTIQAVAKGRTIPVKLVHATRGKHVRAEPIAALYEQGKMRHAEEFSELEDQMCAFTIDFDRKSQGYSPDRVDALVWGLTELFPSMVNKAKPAPVRAPQVFNPMARR